MSLEEKINHEFGHRLRCRVSGILVIADKILMLKHAYLGDGHLWAPPGGGMQFGTDAKANLVREFKEETNLEIEVGDLLFVSEFLDQPLHAIELFYEVKVVGGQISLGTDPELDADHQILTAQAWMDIKALQSIPKAQIHGFFHKISSLNELFNWKGYFKIENNSIK